ncbi:hypothetical protein TNCV_1863551 [Trichonephila clavipes]|nr:hypothetical protein TNCV_1863551 [Trichonephila clavipes]
MNGLVAAAYQEFEPGTAEDSPRKGEPIYFKYVEAQTSVRWCSMEVKRGGASSGVPAPDNRFKITRSVPKSSRVTEQNVNIHLLHQSACIITLPEVCVVS